MNMLLRISVRNVQHIDELDFSINTGAFGITCITGRNGVGKTTLIKAISNLKFSDVFKNTSPDNIFRDSSSIQYSYGDVTYDFKYDKGIRSINTHQLIPQEVKNLVDVELPLPHGARFNFFQSIGSADGDIRRAIILNEYSSPTELIELLKYIYGGVKFNDLVEIKSRKNYYYCILIRDNKYIREDYLSSGEFFLISLYRKIINKNKIIVIDEIDISLDAAAQSRLVVRLRDFCKKYEVNILFSSHSLALMQTLEDDELIYMNNENSIVQFKSASFSYVKSILFGFKDWDKYILTEDLMLKNFIEFLVAKFCSNIFYLYKVIYIGGGSNVTDLMRRNANEEFFGAVSDVISILDGDQRAFRHARKRNTYCIPFESVEKKLFEDYSQGGKLPIIPDLVVADGKQLVAEYKRKRIMSEQAIFEYLCAQDRAGIEEFVEVLNNFLRGDLQGEIGQDVSALQV